MSATGTPASRCMQLDGLGGTVTLDLRMALDFFASFIAGEPAAAALLPVRPLDEEAWEAATLRARRRRAADGVVDELVRQAAGLPASLARDRNLDRLMQAGTTVVV